MNRLVPRQESGPAISQNLGCWRMETSLHTQAIADWLGLFTCMCGRRWAVLTVGQRLEQDPLKRTPLPHRSPTITITATVQASSFLFSFNIFSQLFYRDFLFCEKRRESNRSLRFFKFTSEQIYGFIYYKTFSYTV